MSDRTLTELDRCDRCGSRAYASAAIPSVAVALLFCAHHWREHGQPLIDAGYETVDETRHIVEDADLTPKYDDDKKKK